MSRSTGISSDSSAGDTIQAARKLSLRSLTRTGSSIDTPTLLTCAREHRHWTLFARSYALECSRERVRISNWRPSSREMPSTGRYARSSSSRQGLSSRSHGRRRPTRDEHGPLKSTRLSNQWRPVPVVGVPIELMKTFVALLPQVHCGSYCSDTGDARPNTTLCVAPFSQEISTPR